MLDLAPEIEKTVRDGARREGLTENDYIARLVKSAAPPPRDVQVPDIPTAWQIKRDTSDDEKRAGVLEYISLSKEEAILRNAPSIARFEAQLAEAENATPEEIAEADAEWEAHKQSMNANRRLTGELPLYPDLPEPQETHP